MTKVTTPLAILLTAAAVCAPAASAQSLTLHISRDYYLSHGSAALQRGDALEAVTYLQKALRKNLTAAERVSAGNSLCAAEYILGNYDAAANACNAAIEADASYWKAYVNRGNVRRAQGDSAGALADYCTAYGLEPRKVSGKFTENCPA